MSDASAPQSQPKPSSVLATTLRLVWHCLKVFAAHYRHAPLQAMGILLGVTLAVTLLVGVRATNDNAIRSYSESTELLSQRASALLVATEGRMDESWYFKLRQSPLIPPLALLSGDVEDAQGRRWRLQGSDIIAALSSGLYSRGNKQAQDNKQHKQLTLPKNLPLGRLLRGDNILLMSASLAQSIATDGVIELKSQTFEVIALDDELGLGNSILCDISLAQQLLNAKGRLSYIALFDPQEDLDAKLSKHLGKDYRQHLRPIKKDNGKALTALTRSFHLNLNAMSLLAFIVGLFIAYNGVRYSLLKRQRLLIKLLQLGTSRSALMTALFCELLFLVVVGSLLGFIAGLQLSQWLQPMVALTLEQLYGAKLLPGVFEWRWLAQAIILTLIAAMTACLPLYLGLCRQPLAQSASRTQLQTNAENQAIRLFKFASLLLLVALCLQAFSQQYEQSMILMGLVIIAIPLLLPLSLHYGSRGLSYLNKNLPLSIGLSGEMRQISHYILAETRELIAPLSLAMMAMLLALCANIAMNTLVGSFDITLRQWLNNRLHAELYLRPSLDKYPQVQSYLAEHKDVTGVYEQWNARVSFKQIPTNLTTRDDYSLRHTSVMKSQIDDFWPQFFRGKTLMISEPLAIKLNLRIGDKIPLAEIAQTKLTDKLMETITIGGIYFDYGNPLGEIVMNKPLWQRLGHKASFKSLAINLNGEQADLDERVQSISTEIQSQFDMSPANIYSQKKIKIQAIKMFNRTFSITTVLNSLTLLVAAIGLFSAVVMLTQARQAPLARLYALGLSRRQLRGAVFIQMLSIILLTSLIALPTGALLSYLLINKVTLQAFGWTIPMVWDWWQCAKLVLLALITGGIAVSLPLYWQTRKPLIASLQQEAI